MLEPCTDKGETQRGVATKKSTRHHVKITMDGYLSKNKPAPVWMFRAELRAMFMEELRNQRDLMLRTNKKVSGKKPSKREMTKKFTLVFVPTHPSSSSSSSSSPPPPPPSQPQPLPNQLPAVEYYKERYGSMSRIVLKVDGLFGLAARTTANVDAETYSVESLGLTDPFRSVHGNVFAHLNELKTRLANAQKSTRNVLDEMVRNHQSVSQTCDLIVHETHKRYRTRENYSKDGIAVIVDKREKSQLSQLRVKYDIFVKQKTTLLEALANMMTLTCDLIVHKKKLDVHFFEYCMNLMSMQSNVFGHAKPTTVSTLGRSKQPNL